MKKQVKSVCLDTEVIDKINELSKEAKRSFSSTVENILSGVEGFPSLPLKDKKDFPNVPCVYLAIDNNNIVQYIGRTKDLNNRWLSHHRFKQLEELGEIKITYIQVEEDNLDLVESELIELLNPILNDTSTGIPGKAYVQVYIDQELKNKFKNICAEKGTTSSCVLRQFVIQYVKNESRIST